VRWIGVVVLLDYIAGTLCMITAGVYLALKVLNEHIFPDDPQNLVFRLAVEAHWFAHAVGLGGLPGLSEHRAVWKLSNRFFTDSFLVTMFVMHVAASAVCLWLGHAMAQRRHWARWTQAVLAVLALLCIVAYAVAYALTDAPRAGLVAIAGAAIVPAWVTYALMSSASASVFSAEYRDVTEGTQVMGRRLPFLVRFMLGGIFGLFVVGCLAAFFWISVPTAILLERLTF
jgi:hypothetical protein